MLQICCLNRLFVSNFVICSYYFFSLLLWINVTFRTKVTAFPQVRLYSLIFRYKYSSAVKESLFRKWSLKRYSIFCWTSNSKLYRLCLTLGQTGKFYAEIIVVVKVLTLSETDIYVRRDPLAYSFTTSIAMYCLVEMLLANNVPNQHLFFIQNCLIFCLM